MLTIMVVLSVGVCYSLVVHVMRGLLGFIFVCVLHEMMGNAWKRACS